MGEAPQTNFAKAKIRSYVERIEVLEKEKQEIAEDIKLVKAEAAHEGFNTKILALVVKRRAMKPHELQEGEALLDLYEHALGQVPPPPLFRAMGLGANDTLAREAVIERMQELVPPGGEIIVKIGKQPVRIQRRDDGEVVVSDYTEPKAGSRSSVDPAATQAPARARVEVPDVDDDGAEELGVKAAKENKPIIANPFPYGDKRRWRWDTGWRRETGMDGMGPNGDDPGN